ncbi:MAG: hypothetical protein R3B96_13040 [Pirellulaceae bacterium]
MLIDSTLKKSLDEERLAALAGWPHPLADILQVRYPHLRNETQVI